MTHSAAVASPSPSSPRQERQHTEALARLVAASDPLMAALRCVRALELGPWCIGAGVVRGLVWDALHGFEANVAADADVVHFDPASAPERDAELERRLRAGLPPLAWEVTNQAHVHRWFEACGQAVAPLRSLEEGVATWPEIATCVGVALAADDSIHVVAPHGLDDLFALRVRHNPTRAGIDVYRERVRAKRWRERWPCLDIADA